MKHATSCKFCKIPITLTIDESYANLGDPLKLIPMACCNRCAELRVEKRRLETKVGSAVNRLMRVGKMDEEERKEHGEGLSSLLQEYAKMIARWHRKDGMCWDDEIVKAMMDNPTEWASILGRLWRMYRDWMKQAEPGA